MTRGIKSTCSSAKIIPSDGLQESDKMYPNKNVNCGLENYFQPDQTKTDVVRCLLHQLKTSGISYIDDSDDDDFRKQTGIESVGSLNSYSEHFEALLWQSDKTYSAFVLQFNPSNCASKRSHNDEEWSSLNNYFLQIHRTEGPSILHSLPSESSAKGVPVLNERSLQENQAILFPSGTSSAVKTVKNDETDGFSRRPQTPYDTTTTLVVHQTSPNALHAPRTVLGLRQSSDLAATQLNLNHQTKDWPSSDAKVVRPSKPEEPTLLSQDKQCITLALPSSGQCFPTIEVVHTISLKCVPCNCSMDGIVSPILSRPCLCDNPLLSTNRQQLPPDSQKLQTGEQIVLPIVSSPFPSHYTINPNQSPLISERESSLAGLVATREQDTSQLQEQSSTRACCYGSPVAKGSIKKTGTVGVTSGQSSDQQIFSKQYRSTPSPTLSRREYDCCRSQKIQHSQDKPGKVTNIAPMNETVPYPTSTPSDDSPKKGTCCPRAGHTNTQSVPDSVYMNQPPPLSRSSDQLSEHTPSTADVKCCRKSAKPKTVVVASGNQVAPQLEVDPLTSRIITEPHSSSTRNLETASVELTRSVLSKPSTKTLEYSRTNQDEEDRPCYFCFRRRRKSKPILRDVTQIAGSLEPTETLMLTNVTPITQPTQVIECKPPSRHESKERTLKSDLWRQVPKSRSEPSQPTWKATGHPTEPGYLDKTHSRIVFVDSDATSKEMDLSKELGVQTLMSEVINPVKVVRRDPSEDQTATHYTISSQSRSRSLEKAPNSIVEHPEWTTHESVSVEQHAQPSRSSAYCEDEKRPLYVWIGPREKRPSEAAQVAIEYRAPSPPGVVERFDSVDSNISRPCSTAGTTHRLSEISCQVEPNQDFSTLARTDPPYDSSDDEFYQTVPIEVPTNPTVSTHRDSTHISWNPVQMPTCGCHCHCQFPVVCVPFPYVAAAKMSSAWHYPTTTAFSCTCCCNCYLCCTQPLPTNHNLPIFTPESVQR
ncbi:hypothetical protein EG68_08750 [Paragonimus skrjabini miyazakii]|uniref:Uncharacterized protein n=1 Tax=Paragonimus skrjabini miyazakii TaxID=59628 RepID=A0A8S9YWI5_9TREM|nr:hypothetical protein EG68_08750 [Paragonimus skrjabini miyazakii]